MFNFFSNKAYLAEELKSVVERIPKDLRTWKEEERRLRRKRDIKSKQIRTEYFGLYKYYEGKLFAYLYVLENLGEHNFVIQFMKKRGIITDHKHNKFKITKPW